MTKYHIFEDEIEQAKRIKEGKVTEEEEHVMLKEFIIDILEGAGLSKEEVRVFWGREERKCKEELMLENKLGPKKIKKRPYKKKKGKLTTLRGI